MVEVPDGNARVTCGRRIFSVPRRNRVVGGHLARGGKLHRRCKIETPLRENLPKRLKRRRQTDFRMAVSHGDGGQRALGAGKERASYLVREPADTLSIR